MESAFESGFTNAGLSGSELGSVMVSDASSNSLVIEWGSKNEEEKEQANCLTGYLVEVKDHTNLNQLGISICSKTTLLKNTVSLNVVVFSFDTAGVCLDIMHIDRPTLRS